MGSKFCKLYWCCPEDPLDKNGYSGDIETLSDSSDTAFNCDSTDNNSVVVSFKRSSLGSDKSMCETSCDCAENKEAMRKLQACTEVDIGLGIYE